jgi:hypothetical protein
VSKTDPNIDTLLEVAASTSSALPWGVAVLASIERILLWDTRHDASSAIVEAIANEEGEVIESGAVGSMSGSAVGVTIAARFDSPSLEDLETIAGQLRFRYLMATRPERTDGGGPF